MCGRFSLTVDSETLKEHFHLKNHLSMKPRYNIAPSETIPIIRSNGLIEFARWGLVPAFKANEEKPIGFINARSETILIKPSFKKAFRENRCLIPASGYYEWKTIGRQKQPFYIHYKEKPLFAFAGIYENESCAILTTTANSLTVSFHDRMPVVLSSDDYEQWLNKTKNLEQDIVPLLKPSASAGWEIYPVTTKMNKPFFDDPQCIVSLT